MPWPEFRRLRGEEQSFIVAAYETANTIEAIQAHEENRKAERAARSAPKPHNRKH